MINSLRYYNKLFQLIIKIKIQYLNKSVFIERNIKYKSLFVYLKSKINNTSKSYSYIKQYIN